MTQTTQETSFWHCQAHMPTVKRRQVVFDRGEGCYLWDTDGNRYLDVPASLWYANVGHGRAEIADAVAAQIRKLESYSSFGSYTTTPTLALAERLADLVPIDGAKIFLTSGGSDGIDVAAKLARRYWSAVGRPDKKAVVSRDLAYHGLHAFGTSITGLEFNREGLGRLIPETMTVPTHDTAALAALFEAEGSRIAAFFCEPVLGTGGVIPPAPGYLAEVQRLCRAHDVLFVVDEVITGFGRTGAMFATGLFGLEPDLIVMAKGITSGYLPLGAVAVSPRVAAPFWADDSPLLFRQGLTYAGHATACVAAHANLDILEREGLVDRVASLGRHLAAAVAPLADHPLVTDVRAGVGLLAGIQVRDAEVADKVARLCFDRGYVMRVITNATLQISPPFTVEEHEIDGIVTTIAEALDA
ncbi:MAG: putrescine---pyruvate transaminase [Actinomycetota bacterium]|nr:aminotransferase class-III [Cryptosporangiaceae bacterium]MDQ1676735.1 putrescine---pyruvate transaminase [Actinomycetota bacterium]